jgi:hypothetical protein
LEKLKKLTNKYLHRILFKKEKKGIPVLTEKERLLIDGFYDDANEPEREEADIAKKTF